MTLLWYKGKERENKYQDMVKIDSTKANSAASVRKLAKTGKTGKIAFNSQVSRPEDISESQAISPSAVIQTTDALLSLQEIEGDIQQTQQRAQHLLSCLDRLKMEILEGRVNQENLLEMAQLVKTSQETCQDTQLLNILKEIEQRVQIELAKRRIIC